MSSNTQNIEQEFGNQNNLSNDEKSFDGDSSIINIGKRLQLYINHLGISNNKFGQGIGISGSMISHMINGNNFGIDKLVKILNAYPSLNLNWLLTGSGNMLNAEREQQVANNKDHVIIELENNFLKEQLKSKQNELKTQEDLTSALKEIITLLKK